MSVELINGDDLNSMKNVAVARVVDEWGKDDKLKIWSMVSLCGIKYNKIKGNNFFSYLEKAYSGKIIIDMNVVNERSKKWVMNICTQARMRELDVIIINKLGERRISDIMLLMADKIYDCEVIKDNGKSKIRIRNRGKNRTMCIEYNAARYIPYFNN